MSEETQSAEGQETSQESTESVAQGQVADSNVGQQTQAETQGQQPNEQTQTQAPSGTIAGAKAEQHTFSYGDYVNNIEDETIKEYGSRFKDVDSLLKSNMDLRSKNGQMINVPNENSSEEDVMRYRTALGVPTSADDYEVTLPEEMELTENDEAVLAYMREAAFESHIPAAGFDAFVGRYLEMQEAVAEQAMEQVGKAQDEAIDELRQQHGSDFEKILNAGLAARDALGGQEIQEFFDTAKIETEQGGIMLGDHPVMVNFMANLGLRMAEDGVISPVAAGESENIQAKIDQLEAANPIGSEGSRDPKIIAERNRLYDMLYGGSVVGSGNRTL